MCFVLLRMMQKKILKNAKMMFSDRLECSKAKNGSSSTQDTRKKSKKRYATGASHARWLEKCHQINATLKRSVYPVHAPDGRKDGV